MRIQIKKKTLVAGAIALLGLPLFLAFQNAGSLRANPVPLGHLSTYRGVATCHVRPSAAAAPYYTAIVTSRNAGTGLTNAQLVDHAASRLGYGLSPLGYINPAYAGDCHAVFLAEEVALQVDAMSLRPDPTQVTQIRSVLMPFSFYTRAELAKKLDAFNKDTSINTLTPTAHGTMWYNMRIEVGLIKTLRALFNSQVVDATHGLQDVQVNLRERIGEIWSNQFNTDTSKTDQYNSASNGLDSTMRAQYGTSFYQLLSAVTFHPVMLRYLDNEANRATCPTATTCFASNQNLGRELLELHTIMMGPKTPLVASPYTQTDIEQVSLALAGWNVMHYSDPNNPGATVYNSTLAMPYAVTVMGKSYPPGSGQLTLILKDLANHPTTKSSVCKRLATNLFGPAAQVTKAQTACINAWGVDGQLIAMYAAMLKLPDFWTLSNYKSLYRNPIDLPIAYARGFGLNMKDMAARALGRGINYTHFVPDATLTRDKLIAQLATRSTDSGWWTLSGTQAQIKLLIGAPRNEIAFPTGYEEIGAKNLSPAYIDQGSRAALEAAIPLENMIQSTRIDVISQNWDTWVKNQNPHANLSTATAIKNNYLANVLQRGALVSRIAPSHQAQMANMLFNLNLHPYWDDPLSTNVYYGPAKMLAGMAMACTEGLKK